MYYEKSTRKRYKPTRVRNTPNGPVVGYDVQPIRSLEHIALMSEYLSKSQNGKRNQFMFVLGINTGLRVSDLLWLQARHLRQVDTHVVLREFKTGKVRRFLVNEHLQPMVADYISRMSDNEYLFASNRFAKLPINRVQAYKILRDAGEQFGLHHVGTHTLRKTFGYHYYAMTKDIMTLMMIYNHASQEQTLDYIGWSQELIDQSLKSFSLGIHTDS